MRNNEINRRKFRDTIAAARAAARKTVVVVGMVLALVVACGQPQQVKTASALLSYRDAGGRRRPVATRSDWEKKRNQMQDSLQAVMGPLPALENLPDMQLQYRDSLKERNYTRYTITFRVAADEYLPAYLYIPAPTVSDRKYPAMLALHPTGDLGKKIIDGEGKANRAYAKELAQRGYIVIAPDYPSFGELADYDFKNDRYESGTMKGIFNHIRCVDLLQSMPEVDNERIGVIGHSLGGHNAMYVAAFDTRLKVVISSCGWTEVEYYDIGPVADELYGGRLGPFAQDRYMPLTRDKYQLDGDKLPFNYHEIIALIAPRHFFSNSPVNDANFDVAGVKIGIEKGKEAYRFLHAEDNLQVRYPLADHDFPPAIRKEVYRYIDGIFNHQPDQPEQLKALTTVRTYAQNPSHTPDVKKQFVMNLNEAEMPDYTLPDPLVTDAGIAVTDAKMWWEQRRPELLSLFENEMYGRTPGFAFASNGLLRRPRAELRAEKQNALNGKAVRREVRLHFTSKANGPFIDVLYYLPTAAKQPVPAFIMLNFRGNQTVTDDPDVHICDSWVWPYDDGTVHAFRSTEQSRGVSRSRWPLELIIDRGYAIATACYHDIDPDYDDDFQNGFHPYFYREGQNRPAPNEWGSIGVWAWGYSRIMDFLETEPAVDSKRVAIAGHSRLGKTALWAGAQDQRFAVVISNNSGQGGGKLSRRIYGETVGLLNFVRPHWFCSNFAYYDDNELALPFDQHELLALIAPRPVYLAVAEDDRSADPKGEFLTALNVDAVYRLLGTPGIGNLPEKNGATVRGNMIYDAPMPPLNRSVGATIGFHIRTGGHDVTDFDWEQYLDFTDRHIR